MGDFFLEDLGSTHGTEHNGRKLGKGEKCLLRDGDRAWSWIFQAAGGEKRELVGQAGDAALTRIGGYLRGMTTM